MAIKQIQLRGISRTPSDRLTNDGGCAESLNVQLDNTELAPSFYPDDVTTKRGLPADLEAEKIFVHKTANYENYIVVQSDRVVAYTPDIEDEEPLPVLELTEGEKVNDITSVGNTIIISTEGRIYYLVFNNRIYRFLGDKTPFPYINFDKTDVLKTDAGVSTKSTSYPYDELWFRYNEDYIPTQETWNNDSADSTEHKDVYIRRCLDALWGAIKPYKTFLGRISHPIVIRYEVQLLDGRKSSMPILITANNAINVRLSKTKIESNVGNIVSTEERVFIKDFTYYKILAKLGQEVDLSSWRDIISSIRIYISVPTELEVLKYSSKMSNRETSMHYTNGVYEDIYDCPQYESSADITFNADPTFIDNLLTHSANTFLIKDIKVFENNTDTLTQEFRSLQEGMILDIAKYIDPSAEGYIKLENQDMLKGDDMKHYPMAAKRLNTYNQSLLLIQPSLSIIYDYNRLNSYDKIAIESSGPPKIFSITYEVTYILRGAIRDIVVKAGPFATIRDTETYEKYYPFQIFPDSRAYKMIVKATRYSQGREVVHYGEFEMLPHPYLDCAYYYAGLDDDLWSLCNLDSVELPATNALDDTDNKLLQSAVGDPFTFPLNQRYTLQSKVLGVAIATTALSQGQFGQFPLYVFTEDGIWAMETGADGSFVSQKPLSREVCINPDSITSLDNGVVFVTAQGVMLMQGSQVTNISPFMNGRHYDVEESAKNIINGQKDFKGFIPVIDDETHFLAFVKEAKIAYDYAGRRLIFIKEGEDYQYIYKLDTQTWHKSAYGVKLISPINSYPECLVQGGLKGLRKICWVDYNNWEDGEEYLVEYFHENHFPFLSEEEVFEFLNQDRGVDVTDFSAYEINLLEADAGERAIHITFKEEEKTISRVYDLSTVLDAAESKTPTKGVIATRPLDLGEPDVFKTITDIRVRGQYPKGAVKFILLGSNDGVTFYTINTLRGKAWKLFRIIILADLQPTDRISWIDVQYETKFTNKLR